MKRICTLLSVLMMYAATAVGQTASCGFDVMHAARMISDPMYAQKVQQFDSLLAWAQESGSPELVVNTPTGVIYEIPVVVHVIHTGQAVGTTLNPSDAQITAWINYLTQAWQATWPAYPNASNGGTSFPFRFVLAKRDTACNPTTGIFRVDGSSVPGYATEGINADNTTGADEDDVKALSRFPTDRYYNIWVVTEIDDNNGGSGIQGYAYMASSAGQDWDGTVVQASAALAGNDVLTHEMGHAFNLYHTFEGSSGSTCPTNTNCNFQGDRVCDTDPHTQSFGCPTGTNPCTGDPYGTVTYNFMNYTNCTDRFTAGQRTRAVAAVTGQRVALGASLGSLAPGTVAATACIPTIVNASNTSNAGPRRVTFNTLNVLSSGYNGDGNKVHWDRTCEFGTEVLAGSNYTITVTTGGAPQQVHAYIDYNNDGDFSDPNEDVFVSSSSTPSHTGSIAVPTTGVAFCTALRMRVVADLQSAATVTACGPLTSGQAEDYTVFVRAAPASATLTLTAGGNPSCNGEPLAFAVAAGVGVTVTSVAWQVNGSTVATSSGLTYTSSTFADNDVVSAQIYYNGPCGADSAVSNSITVTRAATVPPTVSIAITAGTNPTCAGEPITFTATGTNTGTAPQYQWFVNGNPIVGANSTTFTTTTLASGDVITVGLLSSSSCASPSTALSSPIVVTYGIVTPTVSILQTAGNNPLCEGKPATFSVVSFGGGTAPTYTWFVNGNGVPGATGPDLTISTLQNGDVLNVLLTSSSACAAPATALSPDYTVAVVPTDTTTLTVALTAGANPGCRDSLLEFTATATNLGPITNIEWFLDGTVVATGAVFSSTTLPNGGILQVRATAGTAGCRTADTLFSQSITLVRDTTPPLPIISYIGNQLVSNITPVQWYGPSGMITGGTGGSYVPTVPGNYYARTTNGACGSRPSNVLNISLLDIADRAMRDVRLYPNPAKGLVTIDWKGKATTAELFVCNTAGQVLMRDAVKSASTKTLNLGDLAAGTYFIVVQDAAGGIGALPVTLMR